MAEDIRVNCVETYQYRNLLFHSFLPMKRIMLFDMICHRLMLFT